MNEAEWRNNDDPKLRELLGYALRTGVSYQDGRHSEAPALLFADYDFEVDDGACGVAADGKRCNEPAIVYARADALMDAIARAELAEAERDAFRGQGIEDAARLLLSLWLDGAFEDGPDAAAQDVIDSKNLVDDVIDANTIIEAWLRSLLAQYDKGESDG